MRFIVDFKRYPTAICVMIIEYMRGDGYVRIETPCSDAYLRWLYLQGYDVPVWWLEWHSTQTWVAGLQDSTGAIAA